METNSRYKLSKVDDPLHDELQKLIEIRELYKADPTKELGMKLIKQAQKVLALSPNSQYSGKKIGELSEISLEEARKVIEELDKGGIKSIKPLVRGYIEKNMLETFVLTDLPYITEKVKLVFTNQFMSETVNSIFEVNRTRQMEKAKRVIIALSQIKKVIEEGQRTEWEKSFYLVEEDGWQKHKNRLFVKIEKTLTDHNGINFKAMLTISYPKGFGRFWPYKMQATRETLDSVENKTSSVYMKLEVY